MSGLVLFPISMSAVDDNLGKRKGDSTRTGGATVLIDWGYADTRCIKLIENFAYIRGILSAAVHWAIVH